MTGLELTVGQQKGLDMVQRLLKMQGTRVGVLAGYAGTGKTTLMREIADISGMPIVVSPTGKAAARVKEATGLTASTIHRWLYSPIDDGKGYTKFIRRPPEAMARGNGLLIVEEASMVSRNLWNDIYDAAQIMEMKVLAVGDPFQLPPVDPEDKNPGDFSLLDPKGEFVNEYVLMKEIVRQALDSPIIRASMLIRGGDVFAGIAELQKVKPEAFLDRADEVQSRGGLIIVHKNKTRNTLNQRIRAVRNLPEDVLQDGELLLVIRNNYNCQSFNGETVTFDGWDESPAGLHGIWDYHNKTTEQSRFGVARLTDGARRFSAVLAEAEVFGRLNAPTGAILKTAGIVHDKKPFVDANLGYIMTCHKSQGSEAAEVLVGIESSIPFWKVEGLKWIYTAVTRAQKSSRVCIGYAI